MLPLSNKQSAPLIAPIALHAPKCYIYIVAVFFTIARFFSGRARCRQGNTAVIKMGEIFYFPAYCQRKATNTVYH